MHKVWWGFAFTVAVASAGVPGNEHEKPKTATRRKTVSCAVALQPPPTRATFLRNGGLALLPFNSTDTETVLAAAAWLRFHGYSYEEIGTILEQRKLRLPDGPGEASPEAAEALVQSYREVAVAKVNALDPRKKVTAPMAVRLLHAANFDEEAIAELLNARGIAWPDPNAKARAKDGAPEDWEETTAEDGDAAGVAKKLPKPKWTARRVAAFIALPSRPGAVYDPRFEDVAVMERVVEEAREIHGAALAQYDQELRTREKADPVFAMKPRSDAEQWTLALAMNYAFHRAILLRERVGPFLPPNHRRLEAALAYESLAESFLDVLHRSNTRLVRQAATSFTNEYEADDLVSEGQFALKKAILTFDVARGFKFSTWALNLIKNHFLRLRKTDNTQGRGGARNNLSLTQASGDEEHELDPEDRRDVSALKRLIDAEGVAKLLAALEELGKADARKCRILKLRYGLEDGNEYTLQEVGEKLGITRERVRQIETVAKDELAALIMRLTAK